MRESITFKSLFYFKILTLNSGTVLLSQGFGLNMDKLMIIESGKTVHMVHVCLIRLYPNLLLLLACVNPICVFI